MNSHQNSSSPSFSLRPRLTTQDLRDLLASRILLFDGAMGTQLQARNLKAADFGGEAYEGCNENLVITRPDVVEDIHAAYYSAGADFVETNSFGGTPLVLAEYDLADRALELNRAAAVAARRAAMRFSDRTRYVAGSMGPTTRSLSITGGVTFDDLVGHYAIQAQGLLEGGADVLLLETSQDARNLKAGIIGIRHAFDVMGLQIPILVSGTIEPMGTTLAGQSAEALHASMEHAGLVSFGLNCATGPDFMADHIRALASISDLAISCMPNAGLPDEDGRYSETPAMLASKLSRLCDKGLLNIVGGCCGTTPAHIQALADVVAAYKPRLPRKSRPAAVSGVDYVDLDEARPMIVGERTNAIGSRAFKRLIREEKFEEAAEIGRKQVRGGAHIVDVCLADPERDEEQDMQHLLDHLVKKVRAPLMIDSTDANVIETALKMCQGKAIVNSINLEDGEERFAHVCPLLHQYGAAVVVGCIDEDPQQGMAVTRERKLAVALRSFDLLTNKYGIRAEDIIFDPLVFPCGTGDQQYIGAAKETVEGVRLIKQALPQCRTILGVSNISFGLPEAGREVVNTVFLHAALEAGLDLAIVNSEKLVRLQHVPEEEIRLAENLLWADVQTFDAALAAFAAHSQTKGKQKTSVSDRLSMPVEDRLANAIVEGSKEGLHDDLAEVLKTTAPLDIINGPLMRGMSEVGRLFAANQLIVAEVLQSAEVMKAAVAFLEPYLQASSTGESTHRATMLLATVRGDVHDIGKNLVDIILSNNGYRVVNLGIKVAAQQIIKAVHEHKPDCIGLSGLLVKSAQEMVSTAEELAAAGINIPILVGGAALTERFTDSRIAPRYQGPVLYAKDAMSGLDLMQQLFTNDADRVALLHKVQERQVAAQAAFAKRTQAAPTAIDDSNRLAIDHSQAAPLPPDAVLHTLSDIPLEDVWPYVNPAMLYTRHLGLKGKLDELLAENDPKAIELHRFVKSLEHDVLSQKLLTVRALYRFYRAAADGDDLVLFSDGGQEAARWTMPRQPDGERRCLADLVPPLGASLASTARDYVGVFVTTCQGTQTSVRQMAEDAKQRGDFLYSHALQALALETAEATAEWLHTRMRRMWGLVDNNLSMQDIWSARYRGKRYSFGYPACPRLDDQAQLFTLLEPARIGVTLTDGFMMDPEASVSALVFHHPQAAYFVAGT